MLMDRFRNHNADADATPVIPNVSPSSVTDKITGIVLKLGTPLWWWIGFFISGFVLLLLGLVLTTVAIEGVGIWAINTPVVWGVAIINLVFWLGIGHAGTLISAILLLMRQEWRASLSRFAEAMTIFALACAGLFPIFHLGRPWLALWILPYYDSLMLNPQWRSPLVWDAFAITTYLTVSAVFWFIGLLPDLASMRDRAENRLVKTFYSALSMGWRGDAMHWERYHKTVFILAALASPLVISVHSIVATDFATGILAGWHYTIFPPYFVAGAVLSGMALVVLIAIPLRAALGLHNLITLKHFDNAGKLMLLTGLMVGFGYLMEFFAPWYTGHADEMVVLESRLTGQYAPYFYLMIFLNVIATQMFWFRNVRTNLNMVAALCVFITIGMWLERFIIVATSMTAAYLPSMRSYFVPGGWDWLTVIAPFGLFMVLLYMFIRFLPMIPIFETQELIEHHKPAQGYMDDEEELGVDDIDDGSGGMIQPRPGLLGAGDD